MQSINPYSEVIIHEYDEYSQKEVQDRIQAIHNTLPLWAHLSYENRGRCLDELGRLLLVTMGDSSKLITMEMGKPISESRAEIEKCALACHYYAKHSQQFLKDEFLNDRSIICFEPLGIVFGIMPWNFPFWQVFRFAAPAIMAGNGIVLKHAPNVSGCSLFIEKLFQDAGFPEHLFQTILIDESRVATVIFDNRISAVTVTGSTRAGSAVAASSGKALKKVVLELGGNDPFIVLPDADLETCVSTAIKSRLINNGQSCIAAKRFIICHEILNDFIDRLKQYTPTMGNPLDENATLGPLARKDLRENLHRQVQQSVKEGATLLEGGAIPSGTGYFYPVTILTDVKPGQPAFDEELFGPVISIVAAKDEQEAISLSNQSSYGLGASIWSQNIEKAEKFGRCIQAGTVYINDMVVSNVELPFGGIKKSGFGRELSTYGIKEFVNIKTLVKPLIAP